MSKKLSSFFVRSNIIPLEEKEIYNYSFEVLLATVLNFTALYLIAVITGRIWETTLFIAGFIPLRSLAGGYHAKTHLRCLMILLGTYLGFLAVIFLMPEQFYFLMTVAGSVISGVLIWVLSPVEDHNKPLSANEKKHFRFRSRAAVTAYAFVMIAGNWIFRTRAEFLCVTIGIFSVAASLIAARIKAGRSNGCMVQAIE